MVLEYNMKDKELEYNSLNTQSTSAVKELYSFFDPTSNKRCGVIFVDIQIIDHRKPRFFKDKNFNVKYNLYKKRPSPVNWREPVWYIISFLVVKGRVSNIWSFPKGRMCSDDNDDEESCAIREVYEETGIKIKNLKNLPRIIIGKNIYFIYRTNKEKFSQFEIHDSNEISEVAWKKISVLKRLSCNKDLRAILKHSVTDLSNFILENSEL